LFKFKFVYCFFIGLDDALNCSLYLIIKSFGVDNYAKSIYINK